MKDFEFINYLVRDNQYLTTDDEKAWYRTALCAALNWGRKIDREQAVYGMAHKCKSYKK